MDRRTFLTTAAGAAAGLSATPLAAAQPPAVPAPVNYSKKDVEACVERGLEYPKREQKPDGHWEAPGGQHPTAMTALAGMAFLMEGSTLREGKYVEQLKNAVKYVIHPQRVRSNGLLGNIDNQIEQHRYMYGHGFATMFLASVYGEEEDEEERKQLKLEPILRKAVEFVGKAQSKRKHRMPEGRDVEIGGWWYTSAADAGHNNDEGSVTVTQLQAVRAAKNAGIPVPIEIIAKAVAYLEACTTPNGGIIYQYSGGSRDERPALTAAALACGISSGEFTKAVAVMNGKDAPTGIARPGVVRWFEFCRKALFNHKGRLPHQEYTSYYFAQAMYMLGEDRYGMLFPNDPKDAWMTWSKYKDGIFPQIMDAQNKNTGGWEGSGDYGAGPIYITTTSLAILLLDRAMVPIYAR